MYLNHALSKVDVEKKGFVVQGEYLGRVGFFCLAKLSSAVAFLITRCHFAAVL